MSTTSHFRKTRGVLYLLSGTSYAARLVVSLHSLRRHYSGPAAVLTTDAAAAAIAEKLAADRLLSVRHVPAGEAIGGGRKAAYLFKPRLHAFTPFHRTVYLDCDTVVAGPIDELFGLPDDEHVLVTQFCDWVTTGRTIARRIRSWRDTHPELVAAALDFGPAINTGVFAFTPHSAVFERWHAVAAAGRRHFIPDELALQLLLPQTPHVVLDGRFNCSARYGAVNGPDVRIIHCHGNKHLRKRCPQWRSAFESAAALNLGGLREWAPAGDRALARHLREHPLGGVMGDG